MFEIFKPKQGPDKPTSDPRAARSPVPWLSDEIWSEWNQEPPACESSEPGPIYNFTLTPVTPDDRQRAKVALIPTNAAVPSEGTLETHECALRSTPGNGSLSWVRWPICCSRLSTLLSIDTLPELEDQVGPLDECLLEAHALDGPDDRATTFRDWASTLEQIRQKPHLSDGVCLFQCRNCGRLYGSYCAP